MHVINLKSEIDVKVAENDILHFKPRLKRRKLDDPIIVKCITCNKQYNIKKCSVFSRRKEQNCL